MPYLQGVDFCNYIANIDLLPNTKHIDVWSMLATLFSVFPGGYLVSDEAMDGFMKEQCESLRLLCKKPNLEKYQAFQESFFQAFMNIVSKNIISAWKFRAISNEAKDFFLWAFKPDPDQRPNIKDIREKIDEYFPMKEESISAI